MSADGMKNGLTRRGPRSESSTAVSAIVAARPPIPEPMLTPVRSLSPLRLATSSLSRTASSAAAIA